MAGLGLVFGGGSAFAAAVTGGKPVGASGAIQALYLNLSDVWAGGIEASQTLDTVNSFSGVFGGTVSPSITVAPNSTFLAAGLDINTALAHLKTPATLGDLALDLGNGDASALVNRGTVTMSLATKRLNNVAGDDLWLTEQGNIGNNTGKGNIEGFMVRLSIDNGATFTSWRYNKPQVLYYPNAAATVGSYFTGFDFVGDFGLLATDQVDLVQIQNVNRDDLTASSSNEGIVILGSNNGLGNGPAADNVTTFDLKTGAALSTLGDVNFNTSSRADADIGYVFYASASPVPEPGTLALAALGAAILLGRRFRR